MSAALSIDFDALAVMKNTDQALPMADPSDIVVLVDFSRASRLTSDNAQKIAAMGSGDARFSYSWHSRDSLADVA